MTDYITTDTELTSIANAIRTKGSTSASLTFPNGFVSAIQNIPSGGGGGNETAIIEGTISGAYTNSEVSRIHGYAFAQCTLLTTVSFPNCEYIGAEAFYGCLKLITASFPVCSSVGMDGFRGCQSLTSVFLPVCERIAVQAFMECSGLITASFPKCNYIDMNAFMRCYNLVSLYLTSTVVVSLTMSTAFQSTPIGGYTASTGGVYGSIFVPASLYSDYISANNWSYFSSRFVSV